MDLIFFMEKKNKEFGLTRIQIKKNKEIEDQLEEEIEKPLKLGRCFHCGSAIYVIDDFEPPFCVYCNWSRVN